MKRAFRAIALDYDGTLTSGARPSEEVLDALRATRAAGITLLLVTGRVLSELRREFPEVGDYFDVIIAENGAVAWSEGAASRALVPVVSGELEAALVARGVPVRHGDVLLATGASYDGIALEEIARLGLDCQLVRNRGELMILPAGVSKGTGVVEALGELGISIHSTIGVGDAENDHALLEACEIGVAVRNAIPALKRHADVVLSEDDGLGVASLLRSVVRGDRQRIASTRWRVALGTRADGATVTIPGSGINVLIAGGSGSGKSYLAGLFAERLVRLGYSICVLDPEGDHTSLGHLRGIVTVGGEVGLPPVPQLGRLLKGRFGGTVIDLSLTNEDKRAAYIAATLAHLRQRREATGLPHWIFLDEAHAALGPSALPIDVFDPADKGFCLVTYHPAELSTQTLRQVDVLFLFAHGEAVARDLLSPRLLDARIDIERVVGLLGTLKRGEVLMLTLGREPRAEVVKLGARRSVHVRHWHKYVHGYLPPRLHFVFRDGGGPTGRSAANLEEFYREVQRCASNVLSHHLAHRDFSQWTEHALQDAVLAAILRAVEVSIGHDCANVEPARNAITRAIEARYGDAEDTIELDESANTIRRGGSAPGPETGGPSIP
jgi:hypothetical protein